MSARVVVIAGPSGSGKSRLAQRLGLPVLNLDDFYKDGADPTLPRIAEGANAGLVDWDHPDSWLPGDALATLIGLAAAGRADVPVYDIAHDGRTGHRELHLGGQDLFLAEGIFAADVVAGARAAGVLAAAYCLRRPAAVTFAFRLARDLRERRKPPLVLLRRGVALLRGQRRVVADAVAKGCVALSPDEAVAAVARLREDRPATGLRWSSLPYGPALRQPDQRSCGAASLVVARMALDAAYAARVGPAGFREEVLGLHRRVTGATDAAGRLQPPWPRALGTPPWAAARHLGAVSGTSYAVRWARTGRGRAFDALAGSVAGSRPAVLFVGDRWIPRHVVAVLGRGGEDGLRVYDPGPGVLVDVTRAGLAGGTLPFGRWDRPWFVVTPRRASRRASRRTSA